MGDIVRWTPSSCLTATSNIPWSLCIVSVKTYQIYTTGTQGKFIYLHSFKKQQQMSPCTFILLDFHQKILEDNEIIKVGVAPDGDAKYLAKDYGICVASTLDVRFMAMLCDCQPGGLGAMSKRYLNVYLEKNWRTSCSDWEAKILTAKQIDYAAKDAHVGIELFRYFADKLAPKPFLASTTNHVKSIIDEKCFYYLDQPFSGKSRFAVNSSNSNSRNM